MTLPVHARVVEIPLQITRRVERCCGDAPFTVHLFISGGGRNAVFNAGERTVDRAALRYSPRSLRGAADDPSLRNQLHHLSLSLSPRTRAGPSHMGTKRAETTPV